MFHPWMMLSIEANQVIALRLMKLILGGRNARREAKLMVAEKINAAFKCPTHNDFIWFQALASRRVRVRMWATNAQATALATMVASKSFASLRQRPSHAKVRST